MLTTRVRISLAARVWQWRASLESPIAPEQEIHVMQNTGDLAALASQIVQAQNGGLLLTPFSSSGRQLSIHEAYEISWLVHEERLRSGWKAVGRKIGFTNRDMWSLFGVTQPVWSFVYDHTVEDVDATVQCPLSRLVQPKIEPEIVLCMRAAPAADAGEQAVLDCIEWIAHGIEMVQCHYPEWKFTSTDAIADCSFHGKLFVGKKHLVRPDDPSLVGLLKNCKVTLYRDAESIEVGHGRNVLGSPLSAITSLIDAIRREGSVYPIQPGEIITTGTMTKAYSVIVGERWRTEFDHDALAGLTIDFV